MVVRVTTAKIEPADSAQPSIATNSFVATAGNLIVVLVRCGTNGLVSSITDTAGNTYEEAISSTGQDPKLFIYYAKNITGHASNIVTVNFSPSAEFSWAYAVQYSGLDTVSPQDAIDVKTGTGVTDLVSDPFNTTREAVVVLGASQAAFTTYTAGTDFTLVDGAIGNSTGDNFGGVEERITSGPLSSYTAHITSGATNAYTLALVAFKAAIAAAGPMLFRGRTFSFFDDDEINRFEFWSPIAEEATVHNRAVSLDATGDILAAGTRIVERSAAVSATGAITVSGEFFSTLTATVAINASAAVESSGVAFTVFERQALVDGAGSIESSATFFSTFERSLTISATGTVEASGAVVHSRSASLDAVGTITASGSSLLERSASLTATGLIAVSTLSILERAVSLDGAATVTVTGQTEYQRQVAFDGIGAISASGFKVQAEIERAVSFDGVGLIVVSGERLTDRAAAVNGVGNIATAFQRELLRAVALDAIGNVSISGSLGGVEHERSVFFTGQGSITVTTTIFIPRGTINIGHENRTIAVSIENRNTWISFANDVH